MARRAGGLQRQPREAYLRRELKRRSARQQEHTKRQMAVSQLLSAVPHKNEAMKLQPAGRGALVSVPVRRPKWLAPPVSWILPWSRHRRVQLDEPGTEVLNLCDGQRTVEEIIERFAQEHRLSFREGQTAVTQFLRELVRRGIIVLLGT